MDTDQPNARITTARSPDRLRTWLLLAIWLQLLLLTLLPQERGLGLSWLRARAGNVWVWWHTRRDPVEGTVFKPDRIGLLELSQLLERGPLGLIYVDRCDGCSLAAVRAMVQDLKARNIRQMCVISSREPQTQAGNELRRACTDSGVQLTTLLDRAGVVKRQLNAFFLPRQYRFAQGGVLEWAQKFGEDPGRRTNPSSSREG